MLFGSLFYVMNPIERTPQDNHVRRSKRRRYSSHSPDDTPGVTRLVPSRNTSPTPIAAAVFPKSTAGEPSSDDDTSDASLSQQLLTQDPTAIAAPSTALPLATTTSHADDLSGCSGSIASAIHAPECLTPINNIPERIVTNMRDAILDVYGITEPRDFQLEAIHHLAYHDDGSLVLIRRTADGKSLVPLTTSILRGGVTLVLVPLHGLGSDQVEKATVSDHNVEAYYIDEHKAASAKILERRLQTYSVDCDERDHSSIIVFASPNALKKGSRWLRMFDDIGQKDLISMVAIDEAHEVHQSGRNFRPEFMEAVANLNWLIDRMPRPVPRLIMSATMTEEDVTIVSRLFGMKNSIMMCGSLERRNTFFKFEVKGDSARAMLRSAESDLINQPNNQQLWYCNSRSTCEGSLLDRADALLKRNKKKPSAQSFTGGDGLKMKTSIMDAFINFADLPDEPKWNDDGTVTLGKITILIATSAANCGISSNFLTKAKHKGFPLRTRNSDKT